MEEGTPTALTPFLKKLSKWLEDSAGASRLTLNPSPRRLPMARAEEVGVTERVLQSGKRGEQLQTGRPSDDL